MKLYSLYYSSILLTLAMLIIACGDKEENIPLITGKWEWTKSITLWPEYIVNTPANVGFTMRKVFTSGNRVKFYVDDSLSAEYQFHIEYSQQTKSEAKGTIVMGELTPTTFEVGLDSLLLSAAYVDGPAEYYFRFD